uniref:Uncharacterized protein n=1 Tax=Cucumis melo TaxID=3656 RepID=A0A9I9EAC4_CUCME
MYHPNEPAIKKFIIPDQEHDLDPLSAPAFGLRSKEESQPIESLTQGFWKLFHRGSTRQVVGFFMGLGPLATSCLHSNYKKLQLKFMSKTHHF